MSRITKDVLALRAPLLTLLILSAAPLPVLAQTMLTQPGMGFTAPSPEPVPASPAPQAFPSVQAPPQVQAAPQLQAAPVSSCDIEMQKFQQRRNAQIEQINKIVKPNKKNQIDPVTACPRMRALVSVETEMRGWMVKNKDWCSIPDPIMTAMSEGTGRTSELAKRACAAAAQMKRGPPPSAAAATPAVKLPSGPL